MPIQYQITPAYIAWRIKKLAYNLVPSKKLRQKLKKALPRKWDVISYSEADMAKYRQTLQSYPDVLTPEQTLALAEKALSFSRIGDGEFNNIVGTRNSFNDPNNKLALRLKEICEAGSTKECVVCLNNYKLPKTNPVYSWFVYHGARRLDLILDKVDFAGTNYGDAYFLIRCANNLDNGLERIKKLWNGQKVLFVCNKKSRIIEDKLNFFGQVAEKAYLYIPERNAFDHYDELVAEIKKYDTSWRLYLEAGATASVLAWDLSKEGYHAFDMGDLYARRAI